MFIPSFIRTSVPEVSATLVGAPEDVAVSLSLLKAEAGKESGPSSGEGGGRARSRLAEETGEVVPWVSPARSCPQGGCGAEGRGLLWTLDDRQTARIEPACSHNGWHLVSGAPVPDTHHHLIVLMRTVIFF